VADLLALSERQRAALVMRELSGLTIDEIADALATSRGAAKQALFEARSALHELAEGRAMDCQAGQRLRSRHDGRGLGGRGGRADRRTCPSCHGFGVAIETRRDVLHALVPPLPGLLGSGALMRMLSGGGGGGGSAGAGGAAVGGSLAAKALTGVA